MTILSNKDQFKRIKERLLAHITINLEEYQELHNFIESEILKRQEKIDKLYNELDELDDYPNQNWQEKHKVFENNDDLNMYRFDHAFPNRTRYFILIQIHVIIEFYIKWFCEESRKITLNPLSISDLKGNAELEKGKIYLSKIFQIDFKYFEPEWTFINNMRKIRNQIVHNNGNFTNKDQEIIRIINNNSDLGILWDDIQDEWNADEDREIKIASKNLIENYLKYTNSFFNKLVEKIEEKI